MLYFAAVQHRLQSSEARPEQFGFDVVVLKMQAVIEVPTFEAGSPRPWPIASVAARSWLTLNAGCPSEEVGLFAATLAHQLDVESPAGRDEVVKTLLDEELLIVAGGLQLVDTATETTVVPGCCAGLEDWRDWAQVIIGNSPDLGHNPSPEVEVADDDLRVWQDGGPNRRRGPWAGISVVVPRLLLPGLLRSVHQDLIGFLAALEAWTMRIGLGESGTALVEAVDRNFTITAPLGAADGLNTGGLLRTSSVARPPPRVLVRFGFCGASGAADLPIGALAGWPGG